MRGANTASAYTDFPILERRHFLDELPRKMHHNTTIHGHTLTTETHTRAPFQNKPTIRTMQIVEYYVYIYIPSTRRFSSIQWRLFNKSYDNSLVIDAIYNIVIAYD